MPNNPFFKSLTPKDAELISHAVSAGIFESIELMGVLIKAFRERPDEFRLKKEQNQGE